MFELSAQCNAGIHLMPDQVNYSNSPLHGLSLKDLLQEIVDHYGFEILYAYLNINCFKTNPSIASSMKFLKKTDWAREKVEGFYLYEYKNLPHATPEQFELPPRDRVIPEDQTPGKPAELNLEDAERLREKRERKAAEYGRVPGARSKKERSSGEGRNKPAARSPRKASSSNGSGSSGDDPWANARKKK